MKSIYVNGYVANLGTKVLIEEKYDLLLKYFSKEFLDSSLNKINKVILDKGGQNPSLSIYEDKIIDKEDISKGGVLSSLWKICERNNFGLKYSLRSIPILQSTIEIANYFDINPYRLLTCNSQLMIFDDIEVNDIVDEIPFVKIGDIMNNKKRIRIDSEQESFLTKDFKDEIDKILPKYTKIYGKR